MWPVLKRSTEQRGWGVGGGAGHPEHVRDHRAGSRPEGPQELGSEVEADSRWVHGAEEKRRFLDAARWSQRTGSRSEVDTVVCVGSHHFKLFLCLIAKLVS